MSCSSLDKVHVHKHIKRCTICDNYTRKIEEVEVTLAGRDAIIDALQYSIKNYEKNYKKLFNDFEDLRFRYIWVSRDNSCLKKINAKLEELGAVKKQINQKIISCRCNYMSLRHESVENPDTNQRSMEPEEQQSLPILQEVTNIEQLVNKQNIILQGVLKNISDELKAKHNNYNYIVKSTQCIQEELQSESGDYLNTTLINLQEEIKRVNRMLDELQQENERLKQDLSNKKKNVCTKSTLCTNFSTIVSPKIDPLNVNDTAKEIVRLQQEIQIKEKHFEACTCQLIEQLNDMHDNNQCLSDTLAVMTAENKNNLAIIAKLKDELNRVNQDHDERIATMKCRICCLENELEQSRSSAKKLKQLIEAWEKENQNVKDRLKHAIEKNKNLKQCQCDAEKEFAVKLTELETENTEMRKELTEKALELTEYEEENRNFCQKLDCLGNYNAELLTKVKELQEPQQKETFEQGSQMSSTNIQPNASKLRLEKQCLEDKCRAHQKELEETKLQLNNLTSSIKTQLGELDILSCENNCLKREMEQVRRDSKSESEKLQSLVNHNQKQVETLLKEHDEKTFQIQNIANELDNIRKSVTKDTDSFLLRIRMLEKERDELKKTLNELKDCNCKETTAELERLKAESIRKQCIILELEKSVDSFNETLKNFDRTAEELACENACLKNDRESRIKDLQTMQSQLTEKTKELDRTRKQLEHFENLNKTGNITRKSLEAENKLLKNQCESLFKTIKKLELENEMLKKEVEKFQAEKGQKEKTLMQNYELQMELDSLKQNHSRRESTTSRKLDNLQKAYDELKNLYDRTNQENSKLKEDIKTRYESDDATKCACESLRRENEKLLKNTHKTREEVDSLNCECDKLRKDLTKRWIEIESLKETAEQHKNEKQLCHKDCQFLKHKQKCMEKELNDTKEKLGDLRKEYDQKSQDLKKIKKQWECCAKQSQITREEYNNLRKEYKDIKSMLSDQIKRCKLDTGSVEPSQSCDVVKDLKRQILDKENQIMALQQKLKDASYEIIEMKDYIHKLIGDNNNLKSGINNLIGNLERKIKGPSFGSLPSNSAEAIAGEILNSLTEIEDVITRNGEGCYRGCTNKPCDCMSEIKSQYSFKESEQGSSNCLLKCRNMMESLSKGASEPMIKFASDPNTSDSEDPNSAPCMEKHCLEFFKEAVQDLKTRIDCTMKEKCCDCEAGTKRNNE